ncbi:uncharacterized protein LOC118151030 [Callithrix jacchus]
MTKVHECENGKSGEQKVHECENGKSREQKVHECENGKSREQKVHECENGKSREKKVHECENGKSGEQKVHECENGKSGEQKVHESKQARLTDAAGVTAVVVTVVMAAAPRPPESDSARPGRAHPRTGPRGTRLSLGPRPGGSRARRQRAGRWGRGHVGRRRQRRARASPDPAWAGGGGRCWRKRLQRSLESPSLAVVGYLENGARRQGEEPPALQALHQRNHCKGSHFTRRRDQEDSSSGSSKALDNTPELELSDIFYFCRKRMETIMDDEVTKRFSAEERESWNLLSRTNYNLHSISLRLTVLWGLGVLIRYCFLLPLWFKEFVSKHVHSMCHRICVRALTAIITYHDREDRPRNGGICVANHTSPIDVIILASDGYYTM